MKRSEIKTGATLAYWSTNSDYRGSARKVTVVTDQPWVNTETNGWSRDPVREVNGQKIEVSGRPAFATEKGATLGVLVRDDTWGSTARYFVARLADLRGDWDAFAAESAEIRDRQAQARSKSEQAHKAAEQERADITARMAALVGDLNWADGRSASSYTGGALEVSRKTLLALLDLAEKAK